MDTHRTDAQLDLDVRDDATVDGKPADRTVRTHSAELWFVEDLVVKRKRPVDLGFLDFRTLSSRLEACQREVSLNRRLGTDAYLGVADVRNDDGEVVDAAVVMLRLPDEQRLSTRAEAGDDLADCVRQVARRLATFHAGQPPTDDRARFAGPAALRTNWHDNLAVLRDHPELADADVVTHLVSQVTSWLDGREDLLLHRIDAGMVRDGHGDLVADDIFCLPDGPEILDCLDFAERYRIADILQDVAFLAMDLERLGRSDLAALFIDAHAELFGIRHPRGLLHHYIAYRAGVRAKVACLTDDPFPQDVAPYLEIMARHLHAGHPRLVLVGGLPGTGKSTLANALAERLGWMVLRTDEVRKDLVGQAHTEAAGPQAYTTRTTAMTYAELLDRARTLLTRGQSVVLDASWSDVEHREVATAVAQEAHSELIALQCIAPTQVAHQRIANRRGDASDATTTVHDQMAHQFAAWPQAHGIDTDQDPDATLRAAMAAVGMAPANSSAAMQRGDARPDTPPSDANQPHAPQPDGGPPDVAQPDVARSGVAGSVAQPNGHRDPTTSTDDHQEDAMQTPPTDRQGLEVLDPDTCLQLMDLSPVGRIAFIHAGEPVILPVNHLRDGHGVAFRTASGLTLDAATIRATMAFEVDGYDQETRTGWSVLIRGRSDLVDDSATVARLDEQELHPWADAVERPHWVRINATEVSGRRIPDRHTDSD